MNRNFDPKKESAVEEALKLKDEGKRLSYIIAKFPDYESEIREVFGIVAFIRENDNKVSAPKNILKTLLSKLTDNSRLQPEVNFRKEIERENNIYIPPEKDMEDDDGEALDPENNTSLGKWKIIIPVVILAIVMGVILLRSDKSRDVEIINENMETSHNSSESSSSSNGNSKSDNISSSTEEEIN